MNKILNYYKNLNSRHQISDILTITDIISISITYIVITNFTLYLLFII